VRLACAMWLLRNEVFYKLFNLPHSLTHTRAVTTFTITYSFAYF